ncbi:hypothetical protein KAU34_02695 [candidate division WOR-3 bacterium]|nr:hypothetical protein [candidate division WOR-3 bacterium]
MIVVAVILIIIAFLSLFFDTGYLKNPRTLPIFLDILLFILSLIVLIRSIVLYKIGEKEMLSKKVRDLEAKVDFLTKKERERIAFREVSTPLNKELTDQHEDNK